ncbi:MAG: TetR/AcrR family transcriptional regulator [bacterium]
MDKKIGVNTMNENDLREKIIDASRNIFAKFGFKKTTMNEIASAVNRAKSSIYHYYKSKEEIFEKVLEKEEEELKKQISNAVEQESLPQRKLYAYIKTKMQNLNHLVNFYTILKDEYLGRHYQFIEKIKERYRQYEFEVIKNILHSSIQQGGLRDEHIEDTAFTITIALKGFEPSAFNKHDPGKIESYINKLSGILFKGIKQE